MVDMALLEAAMPVLSFVGGFLGNAFFYYRGKATEPVVPESGAKTSDQQDFTREMNKIVPEVAQKLVNNQTLHREDINRLNELFWRDGSQGRQVFDRTIESMLVGELSVLPVGGDQEPADYWGLFSAGRIKDALKQARNQAGLNGLDDTTIDRCLSPIIIELMKAISIRPALSNLITQRQLQWMAERLGWLTELLGPASEQTMAAVMREYFEKQCRIHEELFSIKLAGKWLAQRGSFDFIQPTMSVVRRVNGTIPDDYEKHKIPIRNEKIHRMIADGKKILLIAGAGVGKTLFLQRLHLNALRQHDEQSRIPVFQKAEDFVKIEGELSSRLESILKHASSINYNADQAGEIARKSADQGRLCLFLDGLDQVKGTAKIEKYFLDASAVYWGQNTVVVACRDERILGNREKYLKIFQKFTWVILEPFDTPKLEAYLGEATIKWFGYEDGLPTRPAEKSWLYRSWKQDNKIIDILHTPFYANAAKRVALKSETDGGQLKTRVELLNRFFKELFGEADSRGVCFSDQEKDDIPEFLFRLSLNTLQAGLYQSFPVSFIKENYPEGDRKLFYRVCDADWIYRHLFEGLSDDQYTFYHQLLQEYFAARQLELLFRKSNKGEFEQALTALPFSKVVLELLDELVDDRACFEYCQGVITEAVSVADDTGQGLARGYFITWLLALRDYKGRKPGLKEELQDFFDRELEESQKEAPAPGQFFKIPAGAFFMGGYEYDDEQPVRLVYLSEYSISRYAVTFEDYDRYCRDTGKELVPDEKWGRERKPVINVSHDDVEEYCNWLNRNCGLLFSLPTEAQWEKAARGRYGRRYPWGNDEPDDTKANFSINSIKRGHTVDVDQYVPHLYGLYQMSGNVWEWVQYWYDRYSLDAVVDPVGPSTGSFRVVRGGSWGDGAVYCRAASRNGWSGPGARDGGLGFRLVAVRRSHK